MIRIAVCDDNPEDLRAAQKLAGEYCAQHPTPPIQFTYFSSSKALLSLLESDKRFDVYILDLLMPEIDGITLAQAVRAKSAEAPILFATSSQEYALAAYEVQALRYLIKPVPQAAWDSAISCALRNLPHPSLTFTVKTRDALVTVPAAEIICVENQARTMQFTLTQARELTSVSIRHAFEACLAPLLAEECFLQPHKSFVINLEYVESLTTGEFWMQGGRRIPVSRNNQSLVKSRYLKYLAMKNHLHA